MTERLSTKVIQLSSKVRMLHVGIISQAPTFSLEEPVDVPSL